MLDLPLKTGFLERWVSKEIWKQLGEVQTALKTEISIARVTKFEVICARVLVKSKKEDRRTELIKDQSGSLAMDLSKWGIHQVKLDTSCWGPLWRIVSKYIALNSSSAPAASGEERVASSAVSTAASGSSKSKKDKKEKKDKKG
jgi:hypothetical protein